METRISIISIIVEEQSKATEINNLLHQYAQYIIGRMGLPHKGKGIISVVIDAPQDITSTLSGKLGMIKGASIKTVTSKVK